MVTEKIYIYRTGNSRRDTMTSIKKLAQFVGLGLATMGLVACGGSGSSSGGGTGLMSLAVTDAPIDDAKHVWVEFTHVELQPADDGERVVICLDQEDAYLLDTSGGQASCPAPAEPRKIDLLALQGEESEYLFEGVAVPAGDYAWIRFYLKPDGGVSSPPLTNFLTSSYIVFKDETEAQLIIPGGLQAGLQLVSGFAVPEGGSASFTVDFDLRNMIRPDNQFEGYYRMRRALRLVDNSTVGAITGTVDPNMLPPDYTCNGTTDDENILTCPGLSVFVYEAGEAQGIQLTAEGEDPLTSANVRYQFLEGPANWEHQYTVGFLSEGSYDLKLTLDEDVLDEADNVPVFTGETTVVDFPYMPE